LSFLYGRGFFVGPITGTPTFKELPGRAWIFSSVSSRSIAPWCRSSSGLRNRFYRVLESSPPLGARGTRSSLPVQFTMTGSRPRLSLLRPRFFPSLLSGSWRAQPPSGGFGAVSRGATLHTLSSIAFVSPLTFYRIFSSSRKRKCPPMLDVRPLFFRRSQRPEGRAFSSFLIACLFFLARRRTAWMFFFVDERVVQVPSERWWDHVTRVSAFCCCLASFFFFLGAGVFSSNFWLPPAKIAWLRPPGALIWSWL